MAGETAVGKPARGMKKRQEDRKVKERRQKKGRQGKHQTAVSISVSGYDRRSLLKTENRWN